MPGKLGEFNQTIPTGLHPSVPDNKIPLWIDGENIIFAEESVQPALGQVALFAKPSNLRVLGLIEQEIASARWLFFGNSQKLYSWTEGDASATDRSRVAGYTVAGTNRWSIISWGDHTIATNFNDKVQYRTTGLFADLDTLSDFVAAWRVKILHKSGPFVLGFNWLDGDEIFRWCDEDNPFVWTPSNTNLAGDGVIRDLDSSIVCVKDLAGGIGVFGRDQLHIIQFVGSPLVFSQQHLMNGIGAFGLDSVAVVGRDCYGMGPRGIYRTDGTSHQYIDDPSIHDYIYDSLELTQVHNIVAWDDPSIGVTYWSYPTTGAVNNTRTVGFNRRNGTWSRFTWARSAASSYVVFATPILAGNDGTIYFFGVGDIVTSDSSPMTLPATYAMAYGYGEMGYGGGGYGGGDSGVG